MHTYIIIIALSYKRIIYIEVARTNYLISSLNIFISKTLVPSSSTLFARPSIGGKPYYNSGLFLNRSINLTSTNL